MPDTKEYPVNVRLTERQRRYVDHVARGHGVSAPAVLRASLEHMMHSDGTWEDD